MFYILFVVVMFHICSVHREADESSGHKSSRGPSQSNMNWPQQQIVVEANDNKIWIGQSPKIVAEAIFNNGSRGQRQKIQ